MNTENIFINKVIGNYTINHTSFHLTLTILGLLIHLVM